MSTEGLPEAKPPDPAESSARSKPAPLVRIEPIETRPYTPDEYDQRGISIKLNINPRMHGKSLLSKWIREMLLHKKAKEMAEQMHKERQR